MAYKNPETKKEYDRKWYELNRQYKQDWYQANKASIIPKAVARTKRITDKRKEMLSCFPCVSCRNNNHNLIQWHHIDPSEKDRTIFSGGYGEDRFWNEVLKCVPLCANCHVLIHREQLCLLPHQTFHSE